MFGYNFTTLLIILVIALLLFGPWRLPELGESIGKAIKSFVTAEDYKIAEQAMKDSVQKISISIQKHGGSASFKRKEEK